MTLSNEEIDNSYIDPVIPLLFGRGDTSGIPQDQVLIAHVTLFSGTLINGDLLQYFIDTKGEYVEELKNGLNIIGEQASAAVVQEARGVFQDQLNRVPGDKDYRIALSGNELLAVALKKLGAKLDAMDLYEKAMEYARNHISAFVKK
jgi:hypothetical protein